MQATWYCLYIYIHQLSKIFVFRGVHISDWSTIPYLFLGYSHVISINTVRRVRSLLHRVSKRFEVGLEKNYFWQSKYGKNSATSHWFRRLFQSITLSRFLASPSIPVKSEAYIRWNTWISVDFFVGAHSEQNSRLAALPTPPSDLAEVQFWQDILKRLVIRRRPSGAPLTTSRFVHY